MTTWIDATDALLGSWPGTVAAWGGEAIGVYMRVLEARGLSPEQVVRAILTWPAGSDFPPSAPNLAAAALKDPTAPTFEEMCQAVWGRGGILRARPAASVFGDEGDRQRAIHEARKARALEAHPLVGSFAVRFGIDRLYLLEVDHPDYGELKRKELREAWDRHVEAMQGREVAALVAGRGRGELAPFDPRRALGGGS